MENIIKFPTLRVAKGGECLLLKHYRLSKDSKIKVEEFELNGVFVSAKDSSKPWFLGVKKDTGEVYIYLPESEQKFLIKYDRTFIGEIKESEFGKMVCYRDEIDINKKHNKAVILALEELATHKELKEGN